MRIESVVAFAMASIWGTVGSDSATLSERDAMAPSGITEAIWTFTPDASGKLALTIRVFGPGWAVGEPVDASLSCPFPYAGPAWRWSGLLADPASEDAEGKRSFRLLLTGMSDAEVGGTCRLLGPVREDNEGSRRFPLFTGFLDVGVGGAYRVEVVSRSKKFGRSVGSPVREGVYQLTREKVAAGC